ncbi:hypothetical protein HZC31_07190 [Candidatus Woesearchaeota archaeon]|nr:hypothetical protein [Candidatus Woesearchaeota archaeon]
MGEEQEEMGQNANAESSESGALQNSAQEDQRIAITYETLFDILRMEKRREDLQQLQPSFFDDTVHYLKQKKELIRKRDHESGIDSFDEIKKLSIQYENIQKIIKEIYERREKKILMMALNKSRTKMSTMNVDVLLPQEMEFYQQLTRLLDTYRVDVLEKLIRGMIPKQQIAAVVSSLSSTSSQISSVSRQELEKPAPTYSREEEQSSKQMEQKKQNTENNASVEKDAGLMQVKFLQAMEEFVGPELESYGPFDAHAVAMIPSMIATLFISSGVAVEVR